ncbi:zinc ribbon domain-containing protein [Candidatus Nitrososphaera gargensis]|uniref:zinc ribbon domain-containing protein n=1 Tax=Candidatus Nitrososphaera gargensis TaxID=497727 RepID=UPI003898FE49
MPLGEKAARIYTAYKVEKRGRQAIVVNPNGTSQKCSRCRFVVEKDLSVHTHQCPSCGLTIETTMQL